jgi:hypothetical protein
VINEVFSSFPDLCDQPLTQSDLELFTDGSNFLKERTRYAGYAVVSLDSVLEAQALSPGTSAQKAEHIALGAERTVNIYRL